MIKEKKIFILLCSITMAFLSSCGVSISRMLDKQLVNVEPSPLEVRGNAINFELTLEVPKEAVKLMKKGTEYIFIPYYVYGDKEERALDSIIFKVGGPTLVKKEYSIPYTPVMKRGVLELWCARRKSGSDKVKREATRKVIARGTVATPNLVRGVKSIDYANFNYDDVRGKEEVSIEFFFLQGSPVLRTSEKHSSRGKRLKAFVAEKNRAQRVKIVGTHSPEGPERINSQLAKDRAKAIEDYYRQNMKPYDYKGTAQDIQFEQAAVVNDWTALREALVPYNGISEEDKQKIHDIINNKGTFEEKEKALYSLDTYSKLMRDLYPRLRNAKTVIYIDKAGKSDKEISSLAKKIVEEKASYESLSDAEMAYAAQMTPSLEEREQILKKALEKTKDWFSYNNRGAIYLEKAMISESEEEKNELLQMAMDEFNNSNRIKPNAKAYNNLAMVACMEDNYDKALSYLNSANKLREDTSKGKDGVEGAFWVRMGNYEKAIKELEDANKTPDNLFNKGLAYLLSKKYEAASRAFQEVLRLSPGYAEAYYAEAIIAARKEDQTKLLNNLREAVELNANLKKRAAEDLEFVDYFFVQDFREIVK